MSEFVEVDGVRVETVEDAERLIDELMTEINSITGQLAMNKVIGRLPDDEYRKIMDWRGRATAAKLAKIDHRRKLKLWIKERRRKLFEVERDDVADRVSPNELEVMLLRTYQLARDLGRMSDEMTDERWAMLDFVRDYLRQRGLA